LGIISTIILGCVFQYHLCCGKIHPSGSSGLADADKPAVVLPGADDLSDTALPEDEADEDAEEMEEPDELADFRDQFNADPFTLFFNTGSAQTSLLPEQSQRLDELVAYLEEAPGAVVGVVGHSDVTGERAFNVWMGMERANFIKDYLTGKGIAADRIETSSKGPDEPAADNSTREGRALNRRTVISIN